jgi:hypothetical protein
VAVFSSLTRDLGISKRPRRTGMMVFLSESPGFPWRV